MSILFNVCHTHYLRQPLFVSLHRLVTYNTENLWVEKLSNSELVYPKWYTSQVHILQQSHKEGLAVPYRPTLLYTTNATKLSYYPRVFPCLSILTFHSPVLRTRLTQSSFLRKAALSHCTKYTRITPWFTLLWGDNLASLASLLHTASLLVSTRPRDRLRSHHASL